MNALRVAGYVLGWLAIVLVLAGLLVLFGWAP